MAFSVRKALDTVLDVAEAINPFLTKWDEKQEAITNVLLDKGFTPDEIINYVGVSTDDLEEFMAFELTVRERAKATKAKPGPKAKTDPK